MGREAGGRAGGRAGSGEQPSHPCVVPEPERCGSRAAAMTAPALKPPAPPRPRHLALPLSRPSPALPPCRGSHQPAWRSRGGTSAWASGGGPGGRVQPLRGRVPQQAAHRQALLLRLCCGRHACWPLRATRRLSPPAQFSWRCSIGPQPHGLTLTLCNPVCPCPSSPPLQCGQRPTARCGSSAAPTWPRCSSTAPPSCRLSAAATCRQAPCRRCRCR